MVLPTVCFARSACVCVCLSVCLSICHPSFHQWLTSPPSTPSTSSTPPPSPSPSSSSSSLPNNCSPQLLQSINPKANKIRAPKAQNVPCGPQPTSFEKEMNRVNNSARRLEVLRTCIGLIFENKIHEASKVS